MFTLRKTIIFLSVLWLCLAIGFHWSAKMYTESQFILSNENFSGNVKIAAKCKSTGAGRICFMLWNGNGSNGVNGYLFRFSAIQGERPAQIMRLDNGVATDISTYSTGVPVNAAQLTGPHAVTCIHSATGNNFSMRFNGKLAASATDTTYAVNGPVGYADQVVPGIISLPLSVEGHNEIDVQHQDSNQKALIDFNSAHANQGSLSKLNAVSLGTNVKRSSGVTLYDPDVVTDIFSTLYITNHAINSTAIDVSIPALGVNVTVDNTVSGVNGLDAGTPASVTCYYLYLIYNGTSYAGLLSLSPSSPTLPAGYTYAKLISALFTSSAGTEWYGIWQVGRDLYFSSSYNNYCTTASSSFSSCNFSQLIPPNFVNKIKIALGVFSWTSGTVIPVLSLDGTNAWARGPSWGSAITYVPGGSFDVPLLPANGDVLYLRLGGGGSGTVSIYLIGYILNI